LTCAIQRSGMPGPPTSRRYSKRTGMTSSWCASASTIGWSSRAFSAFVVADASAMSPPNAGRKSLRRNLAQDSVDHHLPAVDVVRLARDPGPGLAGQQDHHVGDVDAGAGPAEGHVAADALVPGLTAGDVVHAGGVDDA